MEDEPEYEINPDEFVTGAFDNFSPDDIEVNIEDAIVINTELDTEEFVTENIPANTQSLTSGKSKIIDLDSEDSFDSKKPKRIIIKAQINNA